MSYTFVIFTIIAIAFDHVSASSSCTCTNGPLPCKGGTAKGPDGKTLKLIAPTVSSQRCWFNQDQASCSKCCKQQFGCESSIFLPSIPGDDMCNPMQYKGKGSIYKAISGYFVRDLKFAVNCANAIKLNAVLAKQHLSALAAFYKEYYVFNDITKNPLGSPSNIGDWNASAISIYSDKLDLQSSLDALSKSLKVTNGLTPFGPVIFGITKIFNGLRDAHVSPNGYQKGSAFGTFNNVFNDLTIKLVPTTADGKFVAVGGYSDFSLTTANGKPALIQRNSNKTVLSIGGMTISDWALSIVKKPTIDMSYKDVNARINSFLGATWQWSSTSLDLSSWIGKTWKIIYTDGSNETLTPVVFFPAYYGLSSIATLSAQASQPGGPFKVFQAAAEKFLQPLQQLQPSTDAEQSSGVHQGRRALSASGSLKPIFACTNQSDFKCLKADGYYGIINDTDTGKQVALWRYTDGFNDLNAYIEAWNNLVNMSFAAGVDRLIYDLTGNGGGSVATAYTAMAAIFPEVLSPDNTYPFLNQYDRHVGKSAQYLLSNNLTFSGIQDLLAPVISNMEFFEKRASFLNSNASALQSLISITNASLASSATFFNNLDINLEDPGCAQGTKYCYYVNMVWSSVISEALVNLPTPITGPSLQFLFSALANMTLNLAPFSTFATASAVAYEPNPVKSELYNITSDAKHSRGGITSAYTGLYTLLTKSSLLALTNNLSKAHPFKQILALGNGLCGSSCDTFSRSSWFYSKNNPSAPSFNYVTIGGSGSPTISATSFPGGNVQGAQSLTQSIGYYAYAFTTAAWSGDAAIQATVDQIFPQLPEIPAFMNNAMPRYSQSEIYSPSLGNSSLPMEYYLIPTDYYLPIWYSDIELQANPMAPPKTYIAQVYPAVINLFKD